MAYAILRDRLKRKTCCLQLKQKVVHTQEKNTYGQRSYDKLLTLKHAYLSIAWNSRKNTHPIYLQFPSQEIVATEF